MKRSYIFALSLALLPLLTYAQGTGLQNLFTNLLSFISTTLIPFILGIAFLFFVINVFRYFIFGGANEEGRENAKNLAIYSVLAFVTIVLFWGLVNLLASSTGLGGKDAPLPDYMEVNGVEPRAVSPSTFGSNPSDDTAADGVTPITAPAEVPGNPVSTGSDPRDTPLCPMGSTWSAAEGSCQAL
jgi:hypothetical protein